MRGAPLTRHRRASVVAALLSVGLVLLTILRLSSAGFSTTTDTDGSGWDAGTIAISDDDTGTALFDSGAAGLLDGGQTLTRCIAVTYTGMLTTDVVVHAHATATGTLAPYLDLVLDTGTGGGAGSCTGFTPTGTVYTGTLADFASTHGTFATGADSWRPQPGQTRSYRFTASVRNTTQAQNATASATFAWTAAKELFTPEILPDNLLWVRAKDLGPAGSAVTTWADRSANSRALTPQGSPAPTVAITTPSGGKAVAFPGASTGPWFSIYDPMNLGDLATSSSDYSTSYTAMAAADNDTGTWWAAGRTTGWLAIRLRTATAINQYTLSAVGTSSAPKTWTFEGSNDGQAWTVLDTRNTVVPTSATTYTFTNTTAYRHYRVNITTIGGTAPIGAAIKELAFPQYPLTRSLVPAAEIWAVVKANASKAGAPFDFGASSDSLMPYDATVYSDFGRADRATFTSTRDLQQWRIVRIATNGTWQAWFDGALQFTGTAPVTWSHYGAIGSGSIVGDITPSPFQGDIAEILIRGSVSTPSQADQIVQYLNREHGLQVN